MNSLVRYLYEQIELTFWNALIPLMEENHPLGKCIQEIYAFTKGRAWKGVLSKALFWVYLGLTLGLTLGLLSSFVW